MDLCVRIDKEWEKIRDQFSDQEKDELRSAISSQVLCPPIVFIDTEKLSEALRTKLAAALR